jgi:hypothetical protein
MGNTCTKGTVGGGGAHKEIDTFNDIGKSGMKRSGATGEKQGEEEEARNEKRGRGRGRERERETN